MRAIRIGDVYCHARGAMRNLRISHVKVAYQQRTFRGKSDVERRRSQAIVWDVGWLLGTAHGGDSETTGNGSAIMICSTNTYRKPEVLEVNLFRGEVRYENSVK
jgi:hypothetical protein